MEARYNKFILFFLPCFILFASCNVYQKEMKLRSIRSSKNDVTISMPRITVDDKLLSLIDTAFLQLEDCLFYKNDQPYYVTVRYDEKSPDTTILRIDIDQYYMGWTKFDLSSNRIGSFHYKDIDCILTMVQGTVQGNPLFAITEDTIVMSLSYKDIITYSKTDGSLLLDGISLTYSYNGTSFKLQSSELCDLIEPIYYKVRGKKTIEKIAEMYYVTPQFLIKLNDLQQDMPLKKGTTIRVQ